jgi:hypothetical protein
MGLIGTNPNQVPTNADLGTMAFEDVENFRGNANIDTVGTITTGKWSADLGAIGRPTIRPSLDLDFANSKMLDPRITFSRANTATYFDSDGLLKIAAVDQPRFEHNPATGESLGLLIEEPRTNLLTYTEDFSAAVWGKGNTYISINATTAPDGTFTADKFYVDATNTGHYLTYNLGTLSAGTYTVSLYVKSAGSTKGYFQIYSANGNASIEFDLTSGIYNAAAGVNATKQDVGNGWYRFFITGTFPAEGAAMYIVARDSSGNFSYTGDGYSGFYIWGAQIEKAAFVTSYIPSIQSFTSRATTATYRGSNGLIQTANVNTARYDYSSANLAIPPKLLLEPASNNLFTYSKDFSQGWTISGLTITTNATTAPDGTLTASKLAENEATNTQHLLTQNIGTVASGAIFTFSMYLKAAERQYFSFAAHAEPYIVFDLINGTVWQGSQYATITPVGNGWYRCAATYTKTNTTGGFYGLTWVVGGGNNVFNGEVGKGVYAWGAQVEYGSSATSYIPTVASTASRAADASTSATGLRQADFAAIKGTNFSSWYRQDEGTINIKANYSYANAVSGWPRIISIVGSNPDKDEISMYTRTTGVGGTTGIPVFAVTKNGTALCELQSTQSITGTTNATFSFKSNGILEESTFGSSIVASSTISSLPICQELRIFGTARYQTMTCGTISKLAYYPKKLSNTEIQILSASN